MLTPKVKDRLSNAVLLALVLGLGFILGVLYGYSSLIEYEWKLGLNQVFSSGFALFLALVAVLVLDRRKQDFRTERDLLVKRAEEAQGLLDKFDGLLADTSYDYSTASSVVKQNRVSLAGLIASLKRCGYNEAMAQCAEIDGLLAELKDMLTDSGKGKLTKKNQVTLPREFKMLIETHITTVRNEYFDLLLKINEGK